MLMLPPDQNLRAGLARQRAFSNLYIDVGRMPTLLDKENFFIFNTVLAEAHV